MIHTTTTTQEMKREAGFTLIELSIVLVIIGLIVGGVLVGQDLIRAAEVRAQISQIEKYNTAVNTFRGKFNAIPGDMSASTASTFGFTTGTSCDGSGTGKRDGNGLIDGGTTAATGTAIGTATISGIAGYEAGMFWQDLSSSYAGNLIDGSFTGVSCAATTLAAGTQLAGALPLAKMGRGMSLYTYNFSGYNWYGLAGIASIAANVATVSSSTYPMTVISAYNIDKKMDDGLPITGGVEAIYAVAGTVTGAPHANATAAATDCYDSGGTGYAIAVNNGAGSNCSLSFRFQ